MTEEDYSDAQKFAASTDMSKLQFMLKRKERHMQNICWKSYKQPKVTDTQGWVHHLAYC